MDPTKETQGGGGTAEPTVDTTTDITPDSRADFNDVGATLVIAVILTFIARRLGRAAAATTFRRWLQVTYAAIWGTAIVVITIIYWHGLSTTWLLLIALAIIVLFFVSVGGLRSFMSGIALTFEQRLQVGDAIRIAEVEGEIIGFGMRSVRLRSVDGTIHEIPNEKFVTESVANLSGDGGDSACEITIAVPRGLEPERAVELARTAAILTPLASPRHKPEVFLNIDEERDSDFVVYIRGYAFDQAHQDHYRSDVVSRLKAEFERASSKGTNQESGHAQELVLDDN